MTPMEKMPRNRSNLLLFCIMFVFEFQLIRNVFTTSVALCQCKIVSIRMITPVLENSNGQSQWIGANLTRCGMWTILHEARVFILTMWANIPSSIHFLKKQRGEKPWTRARIILPTSTTSHRPASPLQVDGAFSCGNELAVGVDARLPLDAEYGGIGFFLEQHREHQQGEHGRPGKCRRIVGRAPQRSVQLRRRIKQLLREQLVF